MKRRQFNSIGLAFAASGLALTARPVIAQLQMGAGTLTTVSDGYLQFPQRFVTGDAPVDEALAIVAEAGLDPEAVQSPCNLALWQTTDRTVLFDVGAGPDFMPSAGELIGSLDALGLAPEDITDVVLTHGHPDHLWGAVDDFDEPLFYNATHYMGDEEHAYWTNPATVDDIGELRQSFAVGAKRRLDILGDGTQLYGAGDEVLPGLTAVPTPGHTPGHMALRLSDGTTSALIIGDAVPNSHLTMARPDWISPADQDGLQGQATRNNLLAELSASQETVVGFHLPEGGIGTVTTDGTGFSFVPA